MATSDITGLVKSAKKVVPSIYSYTTPQIHAHDGWTKIGYTERDVAMRIKEQAHTINAETHLEWKGNAIYEGGGSFTDHEFHAYLQKLGVERTPQTEWFHVDGPTGRGYFFDFRDNRGVVEFDSDGAPEAAEYTLRAEQERAVELALDYRDLHERGEFLWNAKPRFGKTLTTYDFCRRAGARRVLIVTNRPAIANSWYDDYAKFLGPSSGYRFVSETESLRDKPLVLTRAEYVDAITHGPKDGAKNLIAFVSLQDLKGAIDFGGKFDKLAWVKGTRWDVLVIDEAHEGVDTSKTDVAFDHVDRGFTLHLSGTPFKALANEKFSEDAIFNWTYADEQRRKRDWTDGGEGDNPYADLPRLNLFTYQMSEIALDQAVAGADVDGTETGFAFDLNEFFATNERGHFLHDKEVDRFLDALTTQTKFPFSTPELRAELRHTFWMLNRVNSAKALAKKLRAHPVFGEYEIVVAAGDGRLEMGADADAATETGDDDKDTGALARVRRAIAGHDRTITLSVGQLTTGVTVPEWTAVLMLSNMKSPALYMQAAFRAQNPCLFDDAGTFRRKENAYVFDFDPARTLGIFEQFANDLSSDTSAGRGDLDTRKRHIRELLNFFPVLGEDEDGEMVELDAERVLSIPRKIRSQEVVRHGFMSDFLFQNISCVFRAPSQVLDIIESFKPCKEPEGTPTGIDGGTAGELALDGDGEVDVPEELVIGTAQGVFGDKLYGGIADDLDDVIEGIQLSRPEEAGDEDAALDAFAKRFAATVATPLIERANEGYTDELKAGQKKALERKIASGAEAEAKRALGDFKIQRNKIELERKRAVEAAQTDEEEDAALASYQQAMDAALGSLKETLAAKKDNIVHGTGEEIVRTVETARREAKKADIETSVRDHLRGFSRTIPSFLMAYGDDGITLANFDEVIPPDVFLDVTSITVEQFRFLRDGGDFENEETGATEHFDGHIFDPVVFDDSVTEFLRLRRELADYFDEGHERDIFDYVPPQKTNQIYTPKDVVRQMVDLFEEENPGCFDDPAHTFADLYMKSGLFITEIVKRLFRSERMRELFPDDGKRLAHIMGEQVFGMAPTEIIYQIATHYILGPDGEYGRGVNTNFVRADAAELAKDGRLAEFVEETFGGKLGNE